MTEKTILLVEHNLQDEMRSLHRTSVANTVDVARDSQPNLSGLAVNQTLQEG